MGLATFKGGVHPYEGKELSEDKPVTGPRSRYRARSWFIPLSQAHRRTGEPAGSEGRSASWQARSSQRQADLFPQTYSAPYPVR